ncbi:Y-family DNA polymerase [Pontivivens nitratireducens]|nr:DNA polymerase Y family protein [Pontibrevibacter nitratireducens]
MSRVPKRIVSIWFPHLAMERWRIVARRDRTLPGNDVPVVLARDGAHGPVIHAASTTATARGIRSGARIVDVQAIHPDLHVEPADAQGDAALLDRLVFWARRWGPWSARDGADGLFVDVTGVAHLFGGETALLDDIAGRFTMQGISVRLAIAPTSLAAQAFARHGEERVICGPDDLGARLALLSVCALRLGFDTERLLDRLGLKTIGALNNMPRVSLMRRFANLPQGRNPLIQLDRAMGREADPLDAPVDQVHLIARSRLAEPVMDAGPYLPDLAWQLCTDLEASGRGARALRLTIYCVDGEARWMDVAFARASRDPTHMLRLLNGKLDGVDAGFGFDMLTLEALRTEPLEATQTGLDGAHDADADVAGLLDRLSARLGARHVSWSHWEESHLPDRMERRVTALGNDPQVPPVVTAERPIRLLDRPEEVTVVYAVPEGPPAQFIWRRVTLRTARQSGPERIAPEWWRDKPGSRLRDYYKVEVEDGRRFWLYREGVIGDGRGEEPRWFLHGFFA